MKFDEENLVQKTTADYLRDHLGWESVFAYNEETFGLNATLGRKDQTEVVLTRYLREALQKFNPDLPAEAYENAIRDITEINAAQSTLQSNREKYDLLRGGVKVDFRSPKGGMETRTLRAFDFDDPENNHFLCVRELWIKGPLYRRRADMVGFLNGVPLLFIEAKNLHRNIQRAYTENLSDYRDTIPHIFYHNAVVILGNGNDARIGAFSAPFKFFREWKRLHEEEKGIVDMETLLKGVCAKANFLDLFENFILFDTSSGNPIKIVAQNQQFLGVNKAIDAVQRRHETGGKLGVFWHTQGAGKSYSMVFFARKVHRGIGGNFTFLVLTDREDLDNQIYKTFVGCGAFHENDDVRAGSGEDLRAKLSDRHAAYVFSLIQKFNKEVPDCTFYSDRSDIIVMTDEAHRTQYGDLALNMRKALPNANFIGFTGTPLMKNDKITRRIYGGYTSTYGFQRAVEDGATVPLFYDARGEKLGLAHAEFNERIAEKLEQFEAEISDVDVAQRLERELKREYHVLTAKDRLDAIARDFVTHYSTRWESGKAMLVCIDKITCVRMHALIATHWQARIAELERELAAATEEQDAIYRRRQIAWLKETLAAVVISEEQGEVDKFRKWDIDITPHRRLIKDGFFGADGKRIDIETAFKRDGHPFRIAIVCAMWLTGFDVKSLATLYLDKPLQAHTLMQAIARANRVAEGKENGLIVDYCGILKNLRKALATFSGHSGEDGSTNEVDPVAPERNLLDELDEAIGLILTFLTESNVRLEDVIEKVGFERNAALARVKEAVNADDETRKRFEIAARAVFTKFKACLTMQEVSTRRPFYAAINFIYKSLQDDREQADISHIIRELHEVIAQAVQPSTDFRDVDPKIYDISAIDFERLRQEFERSPKKNTQVRALRDVIEKRLAYMIAQNPLRMDFQLHYEQLVSAYNEEKDRVTIEATFQLLLKLVKDLDEERSRAVREGLDDDETLALFDLLKKPKLAPNEIKRIKTVAIELYARLKTAEQEIDKWRRREATRDRVRQLIYDTLYSDKSGLPDSYTEAEIDLKADTIFGFVFSKSELETEPT